MCWRELPRLKLENGNKLRVLPAAVAWLICADVLGERLSSRAL